jgi:tetratricopeptide (TPR) repeat protein
MLRKSYLLKLVRGISDNWRMVMSYQPFKSLLVGVVLISLAGIPRTYSTEISNEEKLLQIHTQLFQVYLKEIKQELPEQQIPTIFICHAPINETDKDRSLMLARDFFNSGISEDKLYYDPRPGEGLTTHQHAKRIFSAKKVIVVGSQKLKEEYEKEEGGRGNTTQEIENLLTRINKKGTEGIIPIWFEGENKKNFPKALWNLPGQYIGGDYFLKFFNLLDCIYGLPRFDNFILTHKSDFERKRSIPPDILERYGEKLLCYQQEQAKKDREEIEKILSHKFIAESEINEDSTTSASLICSELWVPHESMLLKRPALLAQINEKLQGKQGIKKIALAGVVGIGGAGKTTLARQYALSQRLAVVWELNAETLESLKESFESLASALARTEEEKRLRGIQEIKDAEQREKKILNFVTEKLRNYSEWLLIYDNMEVKTFSCIKSYLPQNSRMWGNGKVVITTRDSTIKGTAYLNSKSIIDVDILGKEEALTLFSKICFEQEANELAKEQKEKILKFLEDIPPFPLDVSTAAYYIKNNEISYGEYIKRIKEDKEELDIEQASLLEEMSDYTKTRYGIITLTLKNIFEEESKFKDLLLFMSLLDSQKIPHNLLVTYKNDVLNVRNLLHTLKKHSLITNESSEIDNAYKTISIHRSTQEIWLNYLIKKLHLDKDQELMQSISDTLETYITSLVENEDISKLRAFLSHCENFLNHKNLLTQLMQAAIEGQLGTIHYHLSNFSEAKELLEKSIANFGSNENHIGLARALACASNVYAELGEYAKAKNLTERSLEILLNNFSNNHKYISWCYMDLGMINLWVKQLQEAKRSFEASLKYNNSASFTSPVAETRVMRHYGIFLLNSGEYEKGREYFEQALDIFKNCLTENHPAYEWVLMHLGMAYNGLGRYNEAQKCFEKAYMLAKTYYPENHLRVAWPSICLGEILIELGKNKKAGELFKKSYQVYKDLYGEDNIRVAWPLTNLGNYYTIVGKYEKAERLLKKSVEITEKNNSEKHIHHALDLTFLGNYYKAIGDYKSAKEKLEQAYSLCINYYSDHHIRVAPISLNLGQVYLLQNELDKAGESIRIALGIFEQNNHPKCYMCYESLSDLYLEYYKNRINDEDIRQVQSHKERAIDFLNKALKTLMDSFPTDSSHLLRVQTKLKSLNQ